MRAANVCCTILFEYELSGSLQFPGVRELFIREPDQTIIPDFSPNYNL